MTTLALAKVASLPVDQGLLNQAVAFYNAASRCFSNIGITPLIQNSPMTPGIVCAAFSVELYLKLIHVLASGKAPHGHKLSELFASLGSTERALIEKSFGHPELEAHIAKASTAFVDWRYEHEHEALNTDPNTIMSIATACHRAARLMKPELKVFGENYGIPVQPGT